MNRARKWKREDGELIYMSKSGSTTIFISHSDQDHARVKEFAELYEGSFAMPTEMAPHDDGTFDVFVEEGGIRLVEAKTNFRAKLLGNPWTGLPAKTHRNFTLPTAVELVLLLMSRQRRNDVLNDVMDWYPGWIKKHGHIGAHFVCWWKIGSAVLHGFLDFAERIAEIVGKFRGAK